MTGFTSVARRSRNVPLELELPLLAVVLLAVALAAIGWASYVEVRSAVLQSARSRVESLARSGATTLEGDAAFTLRRMRGLAVDTGLNAYLLSGGARAEIEARAILDQLATETDSLAPAVILSRDGSPLLWSLPAPEAGAGDDEGDGLGAAILGAPADGGFGPIFWTEGRPSAWATVPIGSAHEQIGWLAQLHGLDYELQRLTLDSAAAGPTIRLASTPGDLWSTLGGEPLAAPAVWPFAGASEYTLAAGERQLAHATEVAGTAWFVVAEVPAGEVLADARRLLRGAVGVGAGVILAAALATWLLGRGLTRSIRRLRALAHAIAAGDRPSPLMVRRAGELGALGAALDGAAVRAHGRRRELELRHGEVRELAAELVRENRTLEQRIAAEIAAREEAERNSSMADCLATIGNEIRTPIHAITGYVDLVELDGPLTPQQRDQLARVRSSAKRLLRAIDEFVDPDAARSTVR